MTEQRIFDRMMDAYAEARSSGRAPVSWTINKAAETELLMDARFFHSLTPDQMISEKPFCGLPLNVESDGAETPGYILIMEKPPESAAADKARVSDILEEFKRRDLEAADPADRAAREKAWNPNPPCPDCGSFDHFEC